MCADLGFHLVEVHGGVPTQRTGAMFTVLSPPLFLRCCYLEAIDGGPAALPGGTVDRTVAPPRLEIRHASGRPPER